jgi:hypothetical protein
VQPVLRRRRDSTLVVAEERDDLSVAVAVIGRGRQLLDPDATQRDPRTDGARGE